jgi:heme/copper-type cytochrome/quinol oxidase subunit 2
MKWLWRLSFMLTLLLFLGVAYLLVAFTYSYSDGNRAGYIQNSSWSG